MPEVGHVVVGKPHPARAQALLQPPVVDLCQTHFQILEQIGRGGFSLYEGMDP